MKKSLDAIDEKIVELLQDNARIAIKEIAAQVFLSSQPPNKKSAQISLDI